MCTDGAPSVIGKYEGFAALLRRELPNSDTLMSFHCILHQQSLCAKSALLSGTFNGVIGIVNYIRANAIRHRQFRQMLHYDDETFSVDLPYHSKVRWLSQGQVLEKVLSLQKQIVKFFEDKNISCKLPEQIFCRNAAFWCDVMSKQNQLNVSPQGETKSIYDMWQKIQAFRKKLTSLKSVLSRPQISAEHFPQLAKVAGRLCNVKEYTLVLDSPIEEYNNRFKDFEKHNLSIPLAYQPHLVNVNLVPDRFQMELIELSEDSILKPLFNTKKDPIKKWKNAVEYPRMRQHARQMLSCFGTTYRCESPFSYRTQIKNRLRSQIFTWKTN